MSFSTTKTAKDRRIVTIVGTRQSVKVTLLMTPVRFNIYKLKVKLIEKPTMILTIQHNSFAFLLVERLIIFICTRFIRKIVIYIPAYYIPKQLGNITKASGKKTKILYSLKSHIIVCTTREH